MKQFSVCTSVYRNDRPEHVRQAFDSLLSQTLPPDEVIVVIDGPVPPELRAVVDTYAGRYPVFRTIVFEENRGLGAAMRVAVEAARYEIVARMDSDDIAVPDRFEKQLAYLEAHPECDVLGGQIAEFIGDAAHVVGKRVVPCEHEEILMWLKGRCPFNHMSVTTLRSRVVAAGNYLDWHCNEDYYLWIRMAEAGCRFANLPDVLVNVRVGRDMYARRGGWRYFKSEKGLQDYMYRRRLISLPRYLFNVSVRFVVQVALPDRVRGFVFRKLFRK